MIGERIIRLRKEKKLTQRELADMLNLTPKAVSFYELNQREPSIDILIKLKKIFNVSLDFLICGPQVLSSQLESTNSSDLKEKYLLDETMYIENLLRELTPSQRNLLVQMIELYVKGINT